MSYSTDSFPEEYVPTVFDNYSTDVLVDDRLVRLSLWDTAGQEDYDRLRPLSYTNADIFLVCFSLVHPDSLNNVVLKWSPELRKYSRRAPLLLVGLKKDLAEAQPDFAVDEKACKSAANDIGAVGFYECSAKTRDGLHRVFNEAIRAIVSPSRGSTSISDWAARACKSCCIL